MARTVEDVLARRTRALFLNARAAEAMARAPPERRSPSGTISKRLSARDLREPGEVASQFRHTPSLTRGAPKLQCADRHEPGLRGTRGLASSATYSTGAHDSSGLKTVIAGATASVIGPRSCSRTTPSGPTMNVITPVTSYSAGQATSANPPDMTFFTT
jgi:hypothetical protein